MIQSLKYSICYILNHFIDFKSRDVMKTIKTGGRVHFWGHQMGRNDWSWVGGRETPEVFQKVSDNVHHTAASSA